MNWHGRPCDAPGSTSRAIRGAGPPDDGGLAPRIPAFPVVSGAVQEVAQRGQRHRLVAAVTGFVVERYGRPVVVDRRRVLAQAGVRSGEGVVGAGLPVPVPDALPQA